MPVEDGKLKFVYSCGYYIKHQGCTTTFYVQRYNEDDLPLDAKLQNQQNGVD